MSSLLHAGFSSATAMLHGVTGTYRVLFKTFKRRVPVAA